MEMITFIPWNPDLINRKMYFTNLSHLLDHEGNFPKKLQKEAKELAVFLPLVTDYTTRVKNTTLSPTDIRCFNKGCHGMISSAIRPDTKEIHWYCPVCENEGIVTGWEGTKWDNTL